MRSQPLYLIPGPVELDPAVVAAMTYGPANHSDPDHVAVMHAAIEPLRALTGAKEGLVVIQPGSGTMAMDTCATNMIEPGDKVLLIHSGFFSKRYEDILRWYGAELTCIEPPVGEVANLDEVEDALKVGGFKFLYVTHVETSTSVRNDISAYGALGRKYGAVVVVDGVCSVGGEVIKMDEWGIDLVATCSQKALAAPPGLAITVANPRAVEVFEKRKTNPGSYYTSWNMQMGPARGYEQGKFVLHSTPPIQVINALGVSLQQIMKEGVEARFARHQLLADAVRAAMRAMGLELTAKDDNYAANTVTAPLMPEGIDNKQVLAETKKRGVVFAGGLYADLVNKHIRFGHMGACTANEIYAGVTALEGAFEALGYHYNESGVKAARKVLNR